MARELKAYGVEPQVMTTPLLKGWTAEKMSKSKGNIGINESADEIYGKVMSISDALMWRYYELLTDLPAEIAAMKSEVETGGRASRDTKSELAAHRRRFSSAAARPEVEFIRRFREHQAPTEVEMRALPSTGARLARRICSCRRPRVQAEARCLIGRAASNSTATASANWRFELTPGHAEAQPRSGTKFLRIVLRIRLAACCSLDHPGPGSYNRARFANEHSSRSFFLGPRDVGREFRRGSQKPVSERGSGLTPTIPPFFFLRRFSSDGLPARFRRRTAASTPQFGRSIREVTAAASRRDGERGDLAADIAGSDWRFEASGRW